MPLTYKYALAILLLFAGLPLVFYRADRKFIDLSPTEGIPNSIPIKANDDIRQVFSIQHDTITRVGFYLRPAAKEIPAGQVSITISQDGVILAASSVSTAFLDSEGATQFRFDRAISANPDHPLTAVLSVEPHLDEAIRLQLRHWDGEFDPKTVTLYVNDSRNLIPAAYQVASLFRPPLALQIGGLLILGAIMLIKFSLPLYLLTTPLLYILPFDNPSSLLPVYYYAACALTGFYAFARLQGLPLLPALFGAHVFAFNTWFPLHLYGGRSLYIVISLLPLLSAYLSLSSSPLLRRRLLFSLFLMAVGSLLIIDPAFNLSTDISFTNPRDVFLDPQQSPLSQKTASSWTNFGAYLGIIPIALALWGFLARGLKHRALATILILSFGASFLPVLFSRNFVTVPLSPLLPHLIIFAVFALAFFSAAGFHAFFRFLFPQPNPSNQFTLAPGTFLILFSLLDLWHVSATTLSFL